MGNPLSKELRHARNKEELNLSKWEPGLKILPPQIKHCKRLLRLVVTDNHLIDLPPELSSLGSLEVLDFSNNCVNSFPANLPELRNLQHLDLSNNQLEEIPDEIGRLSQLRNLQLHDNNLRNIPFGVCSIQTLEILNVSNNKITKVGPEIVNLQSLKNLGKLPSLEKLFLGSNNIQMVPESCGDLSKLEELDLQENHQLDDIPRLRKVHLRNTRLSNLVEFNLSDNGGIEEFPDMIGNLINLKRLDASNCSLRNLPDILGDSSKLANQLVTISIPSTVYKLDHLTRLFLTDNSIDAIGGLKSLDKFYANNNKLSTLPQTIGGLQSLTVFELRHNLLNHLPSQISNLKFLMRLDLSHNRLGVLPTEMHRMMALTALDLRDNPWNDPPQSVITQGVSAVMMHLLEISKRKAMG
ncbi:hypothetical protein BC829DRAFT_399234 [Chytridium lagenaria]|nr:hypothetical protein BC829DRAFT_399234 [Chytridium lagenaria]